jgi:hypothetical protein
MWRNLLRTYFISGHSLRVAIDLARVPAPERGRVTAMWLTWANQTARRGWYR